MKVINYGPKYKKSTLICASCQSELEYDVRDVISNQRRVIERATLKPKLIVGAYVRCPVCSYLNALDEKEFPYVPEPPSPPLLRVLWERFKNKLSRKEKENEEH